MALRAVTAGRFGNRIWSRRRGQTVCLGPIYAVKMYEARAREDGTYTWRLLRVVTELPTFSVWASVVGAAEKYAETHNLLFLPNVRQGTKLTQVFR